MQKKKKKKHGRSRSLQRTLINHQAQDRESVELWVLVQFCFTQFLPGSEVIGQEGLKVYVSLAEA